MLCVTSRVNEFGLSIEKSVFEHLHSFVLKCDCVIS